MKSKGSECTYVQQCMWSWGFLCIFKRWLFSASKLNSSFSFWVWELLQQNQHKASFAWLVMLICIHRPFGHAFVAYTISSIGLDHNLTLCKWKVLPFMKGGNDSLILVDSFLLQFPPPPLKSHIVVKGPLVFGRDLRGMKGCSENWKTGKLWLQLYQYLKWRFFVICNYNAVMADQ